MSVLTNWDLSANPNFQLARDDFHRWVHRCQPIDLCVMPRWWWTRLCWRAGTGWGQRAAWPHLRYMESELLRASLEATGLPRLPGERFFSNWGSSWSSETIHGDVRYEVLACETLYPLAVAAAFAEIVKVVLGVHNSIYLPDMSWTQPAHRLRVEFYPCYSEPTCLGCINEEQFEEIGRRRREVLERKKQQQPPEG